MLWGQRIWLYRLPMYVTSGKSLNLGEPLLPHLQSGHTLYPLRLDNICKASNTMSGTQEVINKW